MMGRTYILEAMDSVHERLILIITDDEPRTVDRQSKGPEVIDDVSSSQQGELEEVNDPNDSIKRVLRDSYESQGATIKSYKGFNDESGGYGDKFLCYGKEVDEDGEEVIREETLDGRTTWWVPTRQS